MICIGKQFVYTDLSGKKPMIRLVLTGKVSPTSDQWKGYPVAIGNTLRLKRKEWQIRVLSREGMQVERFICVNTGKQPLKFVSLDAAGIHSFSNRAESYSSGNGSRHDSFY